MNKRVIFMHLPKCGGSTFKSIIRRMYLPKNTFNIRVINEVRSNIEEFVNLSQNDRNKIYLLLGHMEFGLHRYFTDDVDYITFIRNPIERIISYFYYVKRQSNHRHRQHEQFRQDMTLYEFVTKIDREGINNGQIRFISGIKDKEEFMLEKALENIEKHFSFVGTVERFDKSLIILQNMYNWSTPFYEVRNSTRNRPLMSSIDRKTLDAIKYLNNGDINLYANMNEALNRIIKSEKFHQSDLYKLHAYNLAYRVLLKGKLNKLVPEKVKNALKHI